MKAQTWRNAERVWLAFASVSLIFVGIFTSDQTPIILGAFIIGGVLGGLK